MHAAQVVVLAPHSGPIEMTICVPPGPDARQRICIHAQVMARYYESRYPTKCEWCEAEMEAGIFCGDGPIRGFCSTACLLSAL